MDGTHFRRQATIGPYFADFACHQTKIVIEVDGGGHGEGNQMAADTRRTAFLISHGYRVLRFWNNDVLSNVEGVMMVIHQTIGERQREEAPPPLTLRGGRGTAAPPLMKESWKYAQD
ncbi:MAG: endonuclease domain-containing protein [Xanthobacteraceae bacterium]